LNKISKFHTFFKKESEVVVISTRIENIDRNNIINATINALKLIKQTRFFQTERGFQGVLYSNLQEELDKLEILNEDVILELEYQKSNRHGLSQRPDIILHIPAEKYDFPVTQGNYAVWALKYKGSDTKAKKDFDKLDEMFETLLYPLGLFININSDKHRLENYSGKYKDRIHSFAIKLINNEILMTHAKWINNELFEQHI